MPTDITKKVNKNISTILSLFNGLFVNLEISTVKIATNIVRIRKYKVNPLNHLLIYLLLI